MPMVTIQTGSWVGTACPCSPSAASAAAASGWGRPGASCWGQGCQACLVGWGDRQASLRPCLQVFAEITHALVSRGFFTLARPAQSIFHDNLGMLPSVRPCLPCISDLRSLDDLNVCLPVGFQEEGGPPLPPFSPLEYASDSNYANNLSLHQTYFCMFWPVHAACT